MSTGKRNDPPPPGPTSDEPNPFRPHDETIAGLVRLVDRLIFWPLQRTNQKDYDRLVGPNADKPYAGYEELAENVTIDVIVRLMAKIEARMATLDSAKPNGVQYESDMLSSLCERVDAIHKTLGGISEGARTDLIHVLLPATSSFKHRLEADNDNKDAVCEFVADKYFCSRIRCFIQASTFAVRLGRKLKREALAHSLIYSNSLAFPLTLMFEDNLFGLYSFCGGIVDAFCGGWMLSHNDEIGPADLANLFQRQQDPLTHAILFPLRVSLEKGLFYHNSLAARFSRILATNAQKIVVCTTADRISLDGASGFHADREYINLLSSTSDPWSMLQEKHAHLVIGGNVSRHVVSALEELALRGLHVSWQEMESSHELTWKTREPT